MAHDHNDIYSIVERLRILEEGLDKNQRSVNQLSATFKPKTVAVLTAKTDPKNPMAGKLVGGSESIERDETAVAEDVLDRVKKSFADYLSNIADEIKQDTDLKDKKHDDTDIKAKDKQDRDLVTKQTEEVDNTELGSALSGVVPAEQPPGEEGVSMKETAAVKTVTNESGLWEVYGDNATGFEIRHGNRAMKSKFKTIDEAEMALEIFNRRQRRRDEAADYIDEA
jgi:hypothetical protein